MNCSNPYVATGIAFGCGQCMPCRFNRRRIWATRMLVEAAQYKDNAFVTLTYRPENDPVTLVPDDMKLFMYKLRSRFQYWQVKNGINDIKRIRFFGVGEYGDQHERPHFHFMLFNFPTCLYRRSRYNAKIADCCEWCDMVRDAWGHGFVYLGEVENDSAGYVAGYVTKKMTAKDDPRLGNRHPEFARMSLKPGIGANAMFDVAHTLLNYQNTLDTLADVPGEIMVGHKKRPLGRYLHKKLRTYVGRDEKAPQSVMDKIAAELRPVQMAARADEVNPSFKKRLIDLGSTRRHSAAYKRQLFQKRRSL